MVHLKVNFTNSSNPPPCIVDFEMPSESTILDLKERIQTLYPDIHIQAQLLKFDGQALHDSHTLESYEIEDHSVIDLRVTSPRPLSSKFLVQILGTRDFEMEVRLSMKIRALKKKIADELGVPSENLDLYHRNDAKGLNDRIVEDGDGFLSHYNLDDNSTFEAWDIEVFGFLYLYGEVVDYGKI